MTRPEARSADRVVRGKPSPAFESAVADATTPDGASVPFPIPICADTLILKQARRPQAKCRSAKGGSEARLTAKNLDAAEIDFVRNCGLTPERASALRTELDRNKLVSVETSIDPAVAAKFRYARP